MVQLVDNPQLLIPNIYVLKIIFGLVFIVDFSIRPLIPQAKDFIKTTNKVHWKVENNSAHAAWVLTHLFSTNLSAAQTIASSNNIKRIKYQYQGVKV